MDGLEILYSIIELQLIINDLLVTWMILFIFQPLTQMQLNLAVLRHYFLSANV